MAIPYSSPLMSMEDPAVLEERRRQLKLGGQLPPPSGSMEFEPGTAVPVRSEPIRTRIGQVAPTVPTVPKPNVKMATLFNPVSGRRVAVPVGSTQAQDFFSQGFKLETAPPTIQQGTTEQKDDITEQKDGTVDDTTDVVDQPSVEETTKNILSRFGVTETSATSPFTSFAENYRQVYDSMGLTSVKSQIDDITKQYGDLQEKLNDEISTVNENPWLTEGGRQDRVKALQSRYEGRLGNLTNRLTLLNNLHEAGRQEAQFVVSQALAQQRSGEQFRQEAILKAVDIAERQAQAELAFSREQKLQTQKEKAAADLAALKKPEYQSGIVGEYQFYADQEKEAGRTPVSFDNYQTIDANRKAKVARAGVSVADSPLVSAIIANPELFNQLTPTDKAKVIPALNAAGFTAFGKPLSDTAVKEITQSETAIEQLEDLKAKIQSNLQYIGPISGLSALNPYSKARQVQSDIDRVKQNVGKALEGGVLRKEDEEKYKKILATLTDTPDTAVYKVNSLIKQMQSDVSRYKSNQALSGRNVPGNESADPLGIK